ncbi:MAG: endolytic transglycosylase MltG [Caldisericia bacterium]|nr:endolytic transglycosylase MltG [Caldisericia bacterium]
MKIIKMITLIFSIFLLIFLSLGLYAYEEFKPPMNFEPKKVYIKDGMTPREIGKKLKEENIIKNAELFVLFAKYYEIDEKLKSGIYEFNEKMNLKEVLFKLTQGGLPPFIKVTIKEGFTLKDIAKSFEENGLCTKERFFEEVNKIEEYKSYIFEEAKSLEGFLYPDTYYFERENLKNNILMMLENFKKKFFEVYKDYNGKLNKYDILKLASIVEKEAMVDEERDIIAGVFINRLEIGMPLQADPTLKYILDNPSYTLSSKELEIDSPYNSYKYNGLPPTPICNPSIKSIIAVLNPKKTDYLYFVADGKGRHIFAKTFEEHLRNIHKVMP